MSAVREQFELEDRLRKPARGEPVWPMAKKFPVQGAWTEDDYLDLVDERGVEYVNGCLEFLPMPTKTHQRIVRFLLNAIQAVVDGRQRGETFPPGYRVRVPGQFREPDVVCILNRNASGAGEKYAAAADLVVEVVSDDDPDRDLVTKRAEYAAAGIPEYWIADLRDKTLTILTLDTGATEYREAGRYTVGQTARSVLLDGLTVEVARVFETE